MIYNNSPFLHRTDVHYKIRGSETILEQKSDLTVEMEALNSLKTVLFMKVGFHVNEGLEEIILRKQMEERECGVFYWGYGGTLCHPLKQVIPFARQSSAESLTLWLLMSITSSRFESSSTEAREFSADGDSWYTLPPHAKITGSRYALVCKDLEPVNLSVDLSQYSVAIGPSRDRPVSKYLRSRVDKACAFWEPNPETPEKCLTVSFRARLVPPFAVFVR
jgi:hypothetical protein